MMCSGSRRWGGAFSLFALWALSLPAGDTHAATTCSFAQSGGQLRLLGNCTTDQTLFVPDGFTLEGQGFSIQVQDPPGGHFVGAVVQNAGASANIRNLRIFTNGLANVCEAGAGRLKGISLVQASGILENNTIEGISKGSSLCEEGNGIDVSNPPYDGSHPATRTVTVTGNVVSGYQKTGIAVNGDVLATISGNQIGRASPLSGVAANSLQLGYGARGELLHNVIEGNQWDVISEPQLFATAMLVYQAASAKLAGNQVLGDGTDVGAAIFYSSDIFVLSSALERTLPSDDVIDVYGVGLWFNGNVGRVRIGRNTFSGWNNSMLFNTGSRLRADGVDPYLP